MVLDDMLLGLDTKVTQIITQHLNNINELLIRISESHPDDVCRAHASNALQTLSEIVQKLIEGDIKVPKTVELVKFM